MLKNFVGKGKNHSENLGVDGNDILEKVVFDSFGLK